MKGKLNILFVSSEVAPFAKTGGLADVASALPKAMFDLGHDFRVIMPKYGVINERKFTLREVIRLKDIVIPMGNRAFVASVKSAFLPNTKVQVYFLDYKPYFEREDLYTDPNTHQDYPDNAERFAFLCYGVIETLKLLHWEPHVIHCNDWQTGLIPLLINTTYRNNPFLQKSRTLFSIHNLAYQGNFPASILPTIGLSQELFFPGSNVEFWGQFSYLKTGLMYSDMLSTVSPTYAQEIQSGSESGCGMEGILSARSADLVGILNGIDYDTWNPETDEIIPYKYSCNNSAGKLQNKKVLAEKNNLEFNPDIPMIGMISRLADQKGFDLVADTIEQMMGFNLQMIILGTGEEKYHRLFLSLAKRYPGKIAVNLRFDNEMAHLIIAGADIFLMPSRFEPCGLTQLYSLRYGTVPVVRRTGGLADTVLDVNDSSENGNGFVFDEYDGQKMIKAIQRALEAYQDQKLWSKISKKGMRQNHSWSASAEEYVKLYTRTAGVIRKKI